MDHYRRDVFLAALSHGQNYNAFVFEDEYINTIGMFLSACLFCIFTPGLDCKGDLSIITIIL